jgi:hypothetical protein
VDATLDATSELAPHPDAIAESAMLERWYAGHEREQSRRRLYELYEACGVPRAQLLWGYENRGLLTYVDGRWLLDGYDALALLDAKCGPPRLRGKLVERVIEPAEAENDPVEAAECPSPGVSGPEPETAGSRVAVVETVASDPLRDALNVLKEQRALATEDAPPARTVGDVVRTAEQRGPCRIGQRQHVTWRREGRISNRYQNCGGFKCPRCVLWALEKGKRGRSGGLERLFAAWADNVESIHRTVMLAEEWDGKSVRMREIQKLYAKRYLRVRLATGDMVVFTPGARW